MSPVVFIVIPCYNEEDVLPLTAPLFLNKLETLIKNGKINANSRILFVNDGSIDRTWEYIDRLAQNNKYVIGIAQSRNRGHQNAVLAGLMEARKFCDITISIDCDGQDDINAMDEMIEAYHHGAEIVYGVRSKRTTDTWFKRNSAQFFYKLLTFMGVETVYNHADYRLVSAKVLQYFSEFKEVNIFLRGMFPLVGFNSTCVYYERNERLAGESHYPLGKMMSLAFDGITSLSIKPIRLIAGVGIIVSGIGIIGIIWAIIQTIVNNTVAGWGSIICAICFLGGIQLFSLGIIGEYVGKTYMEAKHRPRYIISDRTWDKEK